MMKNKVYNLSHKALAKQYYFTKKLNHINIFNVVLSTIIQKYIPIIDP